MKVLFLDIDGVLNSLDNMYALTLQWKVNNNNKSRDEFRRLFDERCIAWLSWIIIKTDCKIVLSSSWRRQGLDKMQLMWEMRNLPGEIIDITPLTVNQDIVNLYANSNINADRGYEIQEWIETHKPEKYCIVDDGNDMLSHQNFVRCNSKIGLDHITARLIVKILN